MNNAANINEHPTVPASTSLSEAAYLRDVSNGMTWFGTEARRTETRRNIQLLAELATTTEAA